MPLDEVKINERWSEMLRRQGIRRSDAKKTTATYVVGFGVDPACTEVDIDASLEQAVRSARRLADQQSLAFSNFTASPLEFFSGVDSMIVTFHNEPAACL